jgi:putative flippase GtrA
LIARRLVSFTIVGAVGFAVDALVLAAAIHVLGLPPTWARIPSFLCALTATYFGNRFFTFAQGKRPAAARFLHYVAASGFSNVLNLGIYALALALLPPLAIAPFAALVLATAVSMGASFCLYSTFVFGGSSHPRGATIDGRDPQRAAE